MSATPANRLYIPGALMCITAASMGIIAFAVYGARFFGPNWSALLSLAGLFAGAGSALGFTGTIVFAVRPGACRLGARTPVREFVNAAGRLALVCWAIAVGLLVISATA